MNFYPGQQVTLKSMYRRDRPVDEVFTVKKVLQVNMDVYTPQGTVLRGKPYMFEQSNLPDNGQAEKTLYTNLVKEIEITEKFVLGEMVTVKPEAQRQMSKWNYPTDQKFVVIKISASKVNVAKLGGEDNRYWLMQPGSLVKEEV